MEQSQTDTSQKQKKNKNLDQLETKIQIMREHIKNQKTEYSHSDNSNHQ